MTFKWCCWFKAIGDSIKFPSQYTFLQKTDDWRWLTLHIEQEIPNEKNKTRPNYHLCTSKEQTIPDNHSINLPSRSTKTEFLVSLRVPCLQYDHRWVETSNGEKHCSSKYKPVNNVTKKKQLVEMFLNLIPWQRSVCQQTTKDLHWSCNPLRHQD